MADNSTMVVFALDSKEKARELLARLEEMDIADDNIEIKEAAFAHKVSKGRVQLEQSNDLGGGRGAFGGGAIGLIAGTMVAGPLGAAVGGVLGSAVTGLYTKLRDSGVSDKFMKEVSKSLEEGKTALFIMYTGKISQEMLGTLQEYQADLVHGELPADAAAAAVTEVYEETGEELPSEIEIFTEDATEEDAEPVDAVIDPIIAQAAQPAQEVPDEPAAVVDVAADAPAASVVAAAAVAAALADEPPAAPAVEAPPASTIVVSKPAEPPAPPPQPAEIIDVVAEVIPQPSTPAAPPTPEPEPDNLTVIDGIGPKVSKALAAAGITTYDRLMRASELELREALLRSAMMPPKSLETWPRQARFAAEGNWPDLYKYNAKRKLASRQ